MIRIHYTQKIVAGLLAGRSCKSSLTFENRDSAARYLRGVRAAYCRINYRVTKVKAVELKGGGV